MIYCLCSCNVESKEGYSLTEVASILGVSTRTVRRYISEGKLNAELIAGKHGATYIIRDIRISERGEDPGDDPIHSTLSIVKGLQRENRELRERNEQLSFLLGEASNMVKVLEGKFKELSEYKPPARWYKRLIGRR